MIIVGELINASRKKIAAAIESQDTEAIQTIAKDQHEHGANYIDVNAGVYVGKEPEYLQWLTSTVQSAVDISLEKERYEALLPIVAGTDFKVVALCMSDKGMPQTTDERMGIAEELVNNLVKNNVPVENIYVDPLVQPISTNTTFGVEFLNSIEQIIKTFPGIHTVCGLSNIPFGLPERKFLNQTFMVMAIARGLDGAIVDPLDKKMMANIIAAEALAGNDEWCSVYLDAYRQKKFEF